uniref:Uncharacterized protein n=1 Tax=Setaria digitata TaxID=48799 RepID=A0A915Q3C4_9BILA
MSNNSITGTTRLRIKEPIYTSDRRAKFTQRESKKWIRFCTVIGYIFFVSLPAASLSIYYIWIWDPDYISRFPPDKNRTLKMDYTVKPLSTGRQSGRPRYKLDLLKGSSLSSRSNNFNRATVHPSLIRTNDRLLAQKSHKISQYTVPEGQRLKMEPNRS